MVAVDRRRATVKAWHKTYTIELIDAVFGEVVKVHRHGARGVCVGTIERDGRDLIITTTPQQMHMTERLRAIASAWFSDC